MEWVDLDTAQGHNLNHNRIHDWANAYHSRLISNNYTLTDSDGLLIIDTSGGVRTLTLPAAQSNGQGGHVIIRYGSSNVVINRAGSDLFYDGTTSKTLATDGSVIGLMAVNNGTVWYVSGVRGSVT